LKLCIAAAEWIARVPMVSSRSCETSAKPAELVAAGWARHVVAAAIFLDLGPADRAERDPSSLACQIIELALQITIA
jgi:hypothetical protein